MVFKSGNTPWNKGKRGVQENNNGGWNKGIPHAEETKRKISKSLEGNQYRKGIPHSEQTKKKLSESSKRTWENEEFKNTMREKHKASGCPQFDGKRGWNRGLKTGPLSDEIRLKMSKSHIGRTGELSPSWRGGISFKPYCHKFNNRLKERIRNRDDRTCQLCGVVECDQKISVHHIHYDKENCDPDLITLCRSCNSIVNTNRDYYENLFMDKLRRRGLLNFTGQ